jgi:predicted flap endonuclease-1-like 5' DNA nuclease
MPLAPTQAVVVPLVRVNIRDDKGTNRPQFLPIYEADLLQEIWAGHATIEVQKPSITGPGGKPWPADMLELRTSYLKEERRLSQKYARNPATKEPIFARVFPAGLFKTAFERAVSGEWQPSERAPEPKNPDDDLIDETPVAETLRPVAEAAHVAAAKAAPLSPAAEELCRVSGVTAVLADAIIGTLGVTSVAELATVPLDELEQVPGISPASAKVIAESAQELSLT